MSARWLLLPLLGGLLTPPRAAAQALDPKQLAAQARSVLKTHCYRCHHGPGSDGDGDFDVLKVETLRGKRGDQPPYVVPGKPAESYLFQRLALRRGGRGDMPPAKVAVRPGDADRAVIKRWIDAGAPPFPTAEGRRYAGFRDVLAAIRDDLNQARPADQPHLRYFTLAHLHNNPKVPDDDLRVYRAALSKAVNSLSWRPGIVVPRVVDRQQTIFAVDVRDLDWDKDNLWREIVSRYPYGLRFDHHPDRALQQLDREVARLAGCGLPYVRADWFVAAATQPPLYHELLRLPRTAGLLEDKLGVDARLDFENNKLARAGFSKSGVSGQNRVVERHQGTFGPYWKSYDFKPRNPRADLRQLPLGPLSLYPEKKHPFPDLAFVHDGGEILFSLPNRLHGFFLINGEDERIDRGPEDVVSDSLKTAGGSAIVTGQSCMACHKHGLVPFKDQLRTGTAAGGAAAEKVRDLFPEAAVMNRLLQEDEKEYLGALARAVGPFLRVGGDAQKPLKEFDEPVSAVLRLYLNAGVDLQTAALELDVRDPRDLVRQVGEGRLRVLGVGVLLQEGGGLTRPEWETIHARSLMQRVAVELGRDPGQGR